MKDYINIIIGNDNKINISTKKAYRNVYLRISVLNNIIYEHPVIDVMEPNINYWFLPDNKSYMNNSSVIEISSGEDSYSYIINDFQKSIIYTRKNDIVDKKKKKIALCLSGYLRTFKECYPSIVENVIQDHDVDIFIHTYDKISNFVSHSYDIDNSDNLNLDHDVDTDFLKSIPNVKTIVIEKFDDIKWKFDEMNKKLDNLYTYSVFAYLYKIYKCNELKKDYEKSNNFIYDTVIRTRGDQIFTKKIDFNFPDNKILVHEYPWGDEDFIHHHVAYYDDGSINTLEEDICLCDRFAAGSSSNIDYLSNLYNHIIKILQENKFTFSPIEQLFYTYLKYMDLEKRNISFYVKRDPPIYKCRMCSYEKKEE